MPAHHMILLEALQTSCYLVPSLMCYNRIPPSFRHLPLFVFDSKPIPTPPLNVAVVDTTQGNFDISASPSMGPPSYPQR
jgi:hypothetical protein